MKKKTFLHRQWAIVLLAVFSISVYAQNGATPIRTGVKASDAIIIESGIDTLRIQQTAQTRRANTFDDDNKEHGSAGWWFYYEYYKYKYPSINTLGEKVYLTALAAMPLDAKKPINNVVLGCHITITDDASTPSNYIKTGSKTSDVGMLIGHAKRDDSDPAYNCIVILPDYQGYGDTKNQAHPYLAQEVTARQSVDALRYGLELYQQSKKNHQPLKEDWKTVCVGYSQGGSVAMATQRFMEMNFIDKDLHLAGSVCGDGPYDPITTMQTYIKEDKVYMPVALALIVKGMLDYNPYMRKYRLEDFFTKNFIDTGIIDWIDEKKISTSDVQDKLKKLYKFGKDKKGEYIKVSEVFTTEAFNYIKAVVNGQKPTPNPKYDDLMTALSVNDLTQGWQPQYPIYLFHSTDDEVVPYANAEVAVQKLNNPAKPKMVKLQPISKKNHVDNGQSFYFAVFSDPYETKGMKAILGGEAEWNKFNP